MKRVWIIGILLLLVALPAASVAIAQDDMPTLGDLETGEWTQIFPGDDTVCLYGDEYSFFVRPAAEPTDNLMIYFQGGGACWDGFTCAAVGQFASQYDVTVEDATGEQDGLFDFENEANPTADYNVVYIPYCSGDIHSGDNEVTFDVPESLGADIDEITVNFNGAANAQSALDWTYSNYEAPSQVFVTGCSAGGYGAAYHAPYVMDNYAGTRVVQLGDASNGASPDTVSLLDIWNSAAVIPDTMPELLESTPSSFTTDYYIAMTALYPDNVFAQYNTFIDQVQVAFFGFLSGMEVNEDTFPDIAGEWAPLLIVNLSTIDMMRNNFTYYTAGGTVHCVTGRPEFYSYRVGGVSVAEWVGEMLAGDVPDALSCDYATGACLQAPATE